MATRIARDFPGAYAGLECKIVREIPDWGGPKSFLVYIPKRKQTVRIAADWLEETPRGA